MSNSNPRVQHTLKHVGIKPLNGAGDQHSAIADMLDVLSRDVLLLVLEHMDNKVWLRMSMVCKLFRSIVDGMQERMGHMLAMTDFSNLLSHGVNFFVHEYRDTVHAKINCGLIPFLSFRVMQALTGTVGEILVLPMRLKFLRHETCPATASFTNVLRWEATTVYQHNDPPKDLRYGVHDFILKCIDATHKPMTLSIVNVYLPKSDVPRRTLCALAMQRDCMLCRIRRCAYVAVDCPIARASKLCKRCANECMVTERVLVRDWSLSPAQIAELRPHVLRYYATTGHYFLSWIPKTVVCRVLGVTSWPDVMLDTAARRSAYLERRRLSIR